MFDVGFNELLLIAIIGLLVLGPERLPKVAAQVGRWVARARRTANQFRQELEREIALSEIAKAERESREEEEAEAAAVAETHAADTAESESESDLYEDPVGADAPHGDVDGPGEVETHGAGATDPAVDEAEWKPGEPSIGQPAAESAPEPPATAGEHSEATDKTPTV